jgi:hypothetical protein
MGRNTFLTSVFLALGSLSPPDYAIAQSDYQLTVPAPVGFDRGRAQRDTETYLVKRPRSSLSLEATRTDQNGKQTATKRLFAQGIHGVTLHLESQKKAKIPKRSRLAVKDCR